MGHGVALAPPEGCGKAGAFLLDVRLCSTLEAAELFGLTGEGASSPPRGAPSPGRPQDGASHHADCTN